MPTLREHPPTREELSAAYGFQVPAAFSQLMAAAHGWTRKREGSLSDLAEFLGWFPAGPVLDALVLGKSDRRDGGYGGTPPELMRFGDTGVDGAMNGYVVHAPELNAAEYPVARYCPMDSDGVSKVGHDTMDSIRRMLANQWGYLNNPQFQQGGEEPDPAPFAQFAAASGVEWSPDLDELWGEPASPESVPDGWQWAPTLDGVGVLAPRDAFRGEGRGLSARVHGMRLPATESEIRGAERDLADGYPASALYRLRELWWDEWTVDATVEPISRPMAAAYERLNRPLLARLTLERAVQIRNVHRRVEARRARPHV